jgi:hypothetical protein
MTTTKKIPDVETYRCQFCGELSPCTVWKRDVVCPKCGIEYDYTLAQEGDD